MSIVYYLADGETVKAAQTVQKVMETDVVPAAVAAVLGLLACFFGLKLVRLLSALSGLLIGAAAGLAVSFAFGLEEPFVIAAMAAGAVIFACLGAVIRRAGGFLFMFFISAGALESLLLPESYVFHLICLGIGLLIAVVTAVLMDPIIIVLSAVGGGIIAGTAGVCLTGMEPNVLIIYAAGLLLAVLGLVVQFLMKSREVGRKEKRFSESVKEENSMETEVEKARMLLDEDDLDEEEEEQTEESQSVSLDDIPDLPEEEQEESAEEESAEEESSEEEPAEAEVPEETEKEK